MVASSAARNQRRTRAVLIVAGALCFGLAGCSEPIPAPTLDPSSSTAPPAVFADNSQALDVATSLVQESLDSLAHVDPRDPKSVEEYLVFLGDEQEGLERSTFEGEGKNRKLSGQVYVTKTGFVDRSSSSPETVRLLVCIDKGDAAWVDIQTGEIVQKADDPVEELLYVLEFSGDPESKGKIQDIVGGNGALTCGVE